MAGPSPDHARRASVDLPRRSAGRVFLLRGSIKSKRLSAVSAKESAHTDQASQARARRPTLPTLPRLWSGSRFSTVAALSASSFSTVSYAATVSDRYEKRYEGGVSEKRSEYPWQTSMRRHIPSRATLRCLRAGEVDTGALATLQRKLRGQCHFRDSSSTGFGE